MIRRVAIGLVVLLGLGFALAPAEAQAAGTSPVARELDAIRDQLVALNIESALAAINAVLERPDLSDADRVEALNLRAQAHAASDDLAGAEKDFRAILELDAGYVPDRGVTSKKAMARFAKLQAATIGTIHLTLDPQDAAVTVDERPVGLSEAGTLRAIAGERRLRFTKQGFDPFETTVRSVAGQETLLKVQLIPNARTLVVRTDVDGVAVAVDGTPAGVSARGVGGKDGPAELIIEHASIGEHEIRLTKPCYAGETLQEVVSADLSDRSPKVLRVVAMRPARTRVVATGATYDGELRVDAEPVARLPLTSFSMCPGPRKLEVRTSGRVVWSAEVTAEETDLTLDLTPRPSIALVGSHWPASWAAPLSRWNVRDRLPSAAGAELATIAGWSAVSVPTGTDLVLGVIPDSAPVGDERVVLYSPVLHDLEDRPSPPGIKRPSWRRVTIGAVLVDDGAGSVVVASVTPSGPAARAGVAPGDRVASIGGRAAGDASAASETVEKAGPSATLALEVASPGGAPRKLECATTAELRTSPDAGSDASRAVTAAWAAVDAAVGGPDGPAALAMLATLLERAGRSGAALDAWQRVRQMGASELAARAAYGVGVGLQAGGKRADAIESFKQARAEAATRGDAALAAAAGDRLADLGVSGR